MDTDKATEFATKVTIVLLTITAIFLAALIAHLEWRKYQSQSAAILAKQETEEFQAYLKSKTEFANEHKNPNLISYFISGFFGPPDQTKAKTLEEFQATKAEQILALEDSKSQALTERRHSIIFAIIIGLIFGSILISCFIALLTGKLDDDLNNLAMIALGTIGGIVAYKGAKAVAKKLPPKAVELGLLAGGTYVAAKGIKAYGRKKHRQKYGD